MWGRFVNYSSSLLSTHMIYVTTPALGTRHRDGDLSATLYRFFQGEDKSIERGENHYKSGHVQSFSYADGKIVGLLHASRRERDVTYEPCSLSSGVFSTAFIWTIAQ